MFSEMDEKNRKKVFRGALRQSANILKKQTSKNIRSIETKNGRIYIRNISRYTGKTMDRGIGVFMHRDAKGITVAVGGKSKYIDFRLRFFELGTKGRRTKGHKITGSYWVGGRKYLVRVGKGGYRGRIESSKFFARSKMETESRIFKEMGDRFARQVVKVNEKYKWH